MYKSVSIIGARIILYTYNEYVKEFGLRNKRETKSQDDGNNFIVIVQGNQNEENEKVRA